MHYLLKSVEHTDLLSDSSYLFTSAVESSFHLPPGLRIVTPLHQRVVIGIFKSHSIPPICRLIQPVKVAVCKSTYGGGQHDFKTLLIVSDQ